MSNGIVIVANVFKMAVFKHKFNAISDFMCVLIMSTWWWWW